MQASDHQQTERASTWIGAAGSLLWSLVVMAPVVFTQRTFGVDWVLHLFLIRQQELAISTNGVPSVVSNFAPVGAFAPTTFLYGGTLYAIGGVLAALGLGAVGAYVVLHLAITWAATFGTWWAAAQLTRSTWVSFLPAIVLTTSAYYLGDVLGRGGFGSFAATMVIPLGAAGALHIWRAGRPTVGGVTAIAATTLVATGSHNISLLWTVIVSALCIAAAVAFFGRTVVRAHWSAIRAIGLAALGGALANGWFLVGDFALASRVHISGANRFDYRMSGWFGDPALWLSPLRRMPEEAIGVYEVFSSAGIHQGHPHIYVQFPVLAGLWLLGVTVWLSRSRPRLLRRELPFLVPLVILSALVLSPRLWRVMPETLRHTQFSFRLNSWILLLLTAMVIVALVAVLAAPGRIRRAGLVTLAIVAAIGAVQTVWQGWTEPSMYGGSDVSRGAAIADPNLLTGWYDSWAPRTTDGRVIPKVDGKLGFEPSDARDGHATATTRRPAGSKLLTNIVGPTDLVAVDGAKVIGRTKYGELVIRTSEARRVTVDLVWPWYRIVGVLVSAVGLALVLWQVVAALRSRPRPSPVATE